MATKMKFAGFDEFLADLARLAPDFTAETARLEQTMAEQTAETLRAAAVRVGVLLEARITALIK